MVVSEEVNPNSTTTENTKKETSISLKLDYPSVEEEDISPIDILNETEIKDDIIDNIDSSKNESSKIVTLVEQKGIETGIEIQYTSMKLKGFPIKDSNISHFEKEIEQIGLNNTTVHVGTTPLFNTNVRIISFNKFKLIELKTREFKIGLSIKLENNTIIKEGEYFRYEIFSKLKNSRLLAVAELFKNIFSGMKISFKIKDLLGEIIFENPIQSHKFGMIMDTVKKYENIESIINPSKSKLLSETTMDFYTIYLLDSYLQGKNSFNSWLNFRIENKDSIKEGDHITFIKNHNLDFRGINYLLKETILVKDSVTNKEIIEKDNSIVGYRKLVEIQLEKIEK